MKIDFGSDLVSDSLGIVADWACMLNGNGNFPETLEKLMRLVQADSAVLVRTMRADGKVRQIERCSALTGKFLVPSSRSYTNAVLQENLFGARPGITWKRSETMPASGYGSTAYSGGALEEDLAEVVVIVMSRTAGYVDSLELHFHKQPLAHNLDLLQLLSPTLAKSWERHTPGLISTRLVRRRHLKAVSKTPDGKSASILDVENPAGLSRSEFRICSLLREGMTVNLISEQLSISHATVRSHLSSIFQKTGTSSQVELLHLINSDTAPQRAKTA